MVKEDALRVLYSVRKGDVCSATIRFATPFTLLDKRDACIILNMIHYCKKIRATLTPWSRAIGNDNALIMGRKPSLFGWMSRETLVSFGVEKIFRIPVPLGQHIELLQQEGPSSKKKAFRPRVQ